MLSIVATPIGNLEDITYRAVRILSEADAILCEDTRTSSNLLNHYSIRRPLVSFHAHSSPAKIEVIISRLLAGEHLAIISDAGTPGISDPLYALLGRAIEAWIEVSPIPGPSAVITALCASGLHMHDFRFLGFIPIKKWRHTLLTSLKTKDYTVAIYESVHRIEHTLADIEEYFWGDTPVVIGRELTKKFEEFLRMSVSDMRKHFQEHPPKWEFVVMW